MFVQDDHAIPFPPSTTITHVSDDCRKPGLGCATCDFDVAGVVPNDSIRGLERLRFRRRVRRRDLGGARRWRRAFRSSRRSLASVGDNSSNDYDPAVATDATASKAFVSWTEVPPIENFQVHLAASIDGGSTWPCVERRRMRSTTARRSLCVDAGRVVWAYHRGFYFIADDPSVIVTQTSDDDGVTLSPPIVVAEGDAP